MYDKTRELVSFKKSKNYIAEPEIFQCKLHISVMFLQTFESGF